MCTCACVCMADIILLIPHLSDTLTQDSGCVAMARDTHPTCVFSLTGKKTDTHTFTRSRVTPFFVNSHLFFHWVLEKTSGSKREGVGERKRREEREREKERERERKRARVRREREREERQLFFFSTPPLLPSLPISSLRLHSSTI